MTEEELKVIGIDYKDAMYRFLNNEDLYLSLLYEFPNDSSFKDILAGIDERDLTKAFEAAHTLKGVSSNLSMMDLYKAVCPLVEALRHNDLEQSQALLPPVIESYFKIVNAL